VERLRYEGINISSSTVRELAGKGRISEAARILGREVTLSGKVVKGFGVAGKELNAPTANLALSHGLILPDGVFAGEAVTEEGSFPAVFNIGFAPTYEVKKRRIEIHLLNFSGDLYGRKLKVKVLEFLRPERKFSGPEALREQITHDIAQACVIYNKKRQTQEGLQ
jgi:riboflavin kinase/FMN adenylyltransferase